MATEFFTDAIIARVRQGVMRAIVRGTENVRTAAVNSIVATAKTGRVYRRGGVTHRASAPGEAPASDTGRLVNSITTEVRTSTLSGRVTARTQYAAFLEFGTQKMEPRPFMRPALETERQGIHDDIANEVARALGG